jgi:hypothetical protein
MSVLSNSILNVRLPSGNRAVYEVQPQHMNLQHWGASLNQTALEYGCQLAHEKDGQWFKPGGWEEITDRRTVALLERASRADAEEIVSEGGCNTSQC